MSLQKYALSSLTVCFSQPSIPIQKSCVLLSWWATSKLALSLLPLCELGWAGVPCQMWAWNLSCGPVHTRSIWARAGNCTDWTAAQSTLQKWRTSSVYAVRICNSSSRESGVKTLVAAKIGQPSITKSVQVIEKASGPSKRSGKPAIVRLTQCYGLNFSWFLRTMKIWIMFICINV
jgi:hypothetical protein